MVKSNNFLKEQQLGEVSEALFVAAAQPDLLKPAVYPSEKNVTAQAEVKEHKKPFSSVMIACAGVLLCCGIAFSSYLGMWENGGFDFGALTAKKVTLIINGASVDLTTNAVYVDELLAEQNIQLDESDTINLATSKRVEDGATIRIIKSIEISITADGNEYLLNSNPLTVSAALQKAGIVLGENDEISLPEDRYLYDDCQLSVYRITSQQVVEEEEIEPTVVRQESAYLEAGSSETLRVGESGIRQNTYLVTYRDGEEYQRELIDSQVTKEAGTTIVAYGTMVLASRSESYDEAQVATTADGNAFSYTQKIDVEATAYTATGNRTATGTWPKVGTIAVDPNYIPLGSKVYIEGYGFATAEDTGGAIKGYIIDLYMDTYDECINWGRRDTTLYILE